MHAEDECHSHYIQGAAKKFMSSSCWGLCTSSRPDDVMVASRQAPRPEKREEEASCTGHCGDRERGLYRGGI